VWRGGNIVAFPTPFRLAPQYFKRREENIVAFPTPFKLAPLLIYYIIIIIIYNYEMLICFFLMNFFV